MGGAGKPKSVLERAPCHIPLGCIVLEREHDMQTRIIAALIGLFHLANGLAMLVAPGVWFARTPGAAETGPFNPHFIADVGFAFLAGGLAFLAFAWRPKLKFAALGASGFLVFHALLHLAGLAQGHTHHLAVELAAIALPAAVGLFITWPAKGEI
jgi:hypothetical protein